MKLINLLLIDDKKENLISLEALLKDIEHMNILTCQNPNEGLKTCYKKNISIVLVDVQMPDINGFEFVSILKSNPKTNHIIAIMVTAISKEEKYLIKGLESGAVDYLYKPLNPEITIAKVKSFVKQIYDQEEIKQKNIELQQSKKELIRAKEEAIKARKSKEIFLANMSHEIRTPINGIMGILHMLKTTELNDDQLDWLRRLDGASKTLLHIINDILDLSRVDSGMLKIVNRSLSIRELADDIEKIYFIKAQAKGLIFKIELDPHLPNQIKADGFRLQQIIGNFISNSLKFTENGFIKFKIGLIECAGSSFTIRFSVIDTGIGIKEESVEKIFLAFEQADDGINRKFGGTGLGLAIVKRLATLMKGKVYAKSIHGKGSEFCFEATFQTSIRIKSKDKKEYKLYTKLPTLNKIAVLVAEDNDLNSFMLVHMLQSWDCKVDVVKNGKLAVESATKNQYDIILMDTHMPVMSGFEAIQQIKSNKNRLINSIPIITISASVLEYEQQAAYLAGADSVIAKPFDPIILYNKIVKYTSNKNIFNP